MQQNWNENKSFEIFIRDGDNISAEKFMVIKSYKTLKSWLYYFSEAKFRVSCHLDTPAVKTKPNSNLLKILVGKAFDSLKWSKTENLK